MNRRGFWGVLFGSVALINPTAGKVVNSEPLCLLDVRLVTEDGCCNIQKKVLNVGTGEMKWVDTEQVEKGEWECHAVV